MSDNFRYQGYRSRIAQSGSQMAAFLENISDYDLTPLEAFLGAEQPFNWNDRSGTKDDFTGFDYKLTSADDKEFRIQDKRRTSGKGYDLGFEFVRMYKAMINNDCVIVNDGGRDLCQIPRTPIRAINTESGWIAERDWKETRTISDLFILHAQGTDDIIWLKSESVKKRAEKLYKQWLKIFPGNEDLMDRVRNRVFFNESRETFNEEFECPGFDIKCLREPKDMKMVDFQDDTEVKSRQIAKIIAYFPPDSFKMGTEYVVCEKV